MKKLTFFPYFGGKNKVVNRILPYINTPHKIYVEVFGGSGAILLNKKRSEIEVFNDIDSNIVNLFRVIRDQKTFKEFKRLLNLTPYSREEFYSFIKKIEYEKDEVKRAYYTYYILRLSFAGEIKNPSYKLDKNGNKCFLKTYFKALKDLDKIQNRLLNVSLENYDWSKLIKQYDGKQTLFYLDPPYVQQKRKSGGYKFDFLDNDHKRLIKIILKVKGKVILSGYQNKIYSKLKEEKWIVKSFQNKCRIRKGVQKKEILWISPNCDIDNLKKTTISYFFNKTNKKSKKL